jgi:hypothetical protein
MHGQADKLAPGVVYHPEYYGMAPFEHLPDIGEVIAYGINEGRVTQDSIELDAEPACNGQSSRKAPKPCGVGA